MRKVILFICALALSIQLYSMQNETDKVVIIKGGYGCTSSNSVQVTINSSNNTLTTTFKENIRSVTITVKKQNGEVVSQQRMDAKEDDTVSVQVPNYKEGTYEVEITSPEGVLEGKF